MFGVTQAPSSVSGRMPMGIPTAVRRTSGVDWSSAGSLEVDAPEQLGWTAQTSSTPVPAWAMIYCCVLCGSQDEAHECIVEQIVGDTGGDDLEEEPR